MKQPPEYYERIIDGIRRGSGIELDAEFIAKAEEVCGKPFRELTADDLEQASAPSPLPRRWCTSPVRRRPSRGQ